MDELLHPVKDGFAALSVHLPRLLLEQAVEIGIAAVDVGPAIHQEGLEARGGIAEGAARSLDEILELLLRVATEEGHPLEGTELHADAHGLQVVGHRLAEIGVGGIAEVLPGVEAVGISRLGEELLGPPGIEHGRRGRPEEVERARNDAAADPGVSEGQGLVDGGAVDGEAGGEPEPAIVPGRLAVPLVGEVHPERALDHRGLESEAGRPLKLFGELTAHGVDDVHLAALEGG